jgi:cell division transport system ATP-binding protein
MIEFASVTKEYAGGFCAVRDVSFSVDKGEFVFLCGASGAGKTTLLKLLSMEELPSAGRVAVCGYDSRKIRRRDLPRLRRKLGIVFQDFKLLPDRDIFDNVAFSLRATGVAERLLKRKTFEVLAQTGLSHKVSYFPSQLSGGEQQRACIARAIVNDPWVLLADEPTGNLDPGVSQEIFHLLQKINNRGATVVMATHDQLLIRPYHYRKIVLAQGSIVEDGATRTDGESMILSKEEL